MASRGMAADMEPARFSLDAEPGIGFVEPQCPWPVDIAHLRRFTMGDTQLEREVLGLYAEEIPRRLDALRQARTDKEWRMAAHTLKGSSRAVGAWRVAALSQRAERISGAEASLGRAEAVSLIEEAALEARAYIEALASGIAPPALRRSA